MAHSAPDSLLMDTRAPIYPIRPGRQKSSTMRSPADYPLRPVRAAPIPPSSPKTITIPEPTCRLRQTPPPNHPAYDYLRDCLERIESNELRNSASSGDLANDTLTTRSSDHDTIPDNYSASTIDDEAETAAANENASVCVSIFVLDKL